MEVQDKVKAMKFVEFELDEEDEDYGLRFQVEKIGDYMFYVGTTEPCVIELREDDILLHRTGNIFDDTPEERRRNNGISKLQRENVLEWAKKNKDFRIVDFKITGQFYTVLHQYTNDQDIDGEPMVRFAYGGIRIMCTTINYNAIDFMLEQFHIQAMTNILDARRNGSLSFPIARVPADHPQPEIQTATKRDHNNVLRFWKK